MARGFRYGWTVLIAAVLLLGGVVFMSRAGQIQPLDRLPGGIAAGPSIEEITDTSAAIALKTSAPAFCQVNYGSAPEYGQMRRMSMSGPMTDHRIVLPGLQPETVYHVRLTAVDVHARIFQSPDLTFKTKAARAGRPQGETSRACGQGPRWLA